MNRHEKINYVEFPSKNLEVTKAFYSSAFSWSFLDYGPDYCAIQGGGLDGGFYRSDLHSTTQAGSVLVVLFLAMTLKQRKEKLERRVEKLLRIFSIFLAVDDFISQTPVEMNLLSGQIKRIEKKLIDILPGIRWW